MQDIHIRFCYKYQSCTINNAVTSKRKLQYNPQNTNLVTRNIMHLHTSHCALGALYFMLIHLHSTFILLFSTCSLSRETDYKVDMQYSGYARVLHCLALARRNMGKKVLTRFSLFSTTCSGGGNSSSVEH